MRFFTTMQKAGRLEYLLISLVLSGFSYLAAIYLLQVDVELIEGQDVASLDNVSFNAGALGLFAIAMAIIMYLSVINTLRRLKDLQKSGWYFLILFIPFVGAVFSLYLLFAPGGYDTTTYTPYGDNPYDPNSWVPPEAPSANGTGVSYQGHDIYLPGEDTWGQDEQAA